jgi:hypothetical protein
VSRLDRRLKRGKGVLWALAALVIVPPLGLFLLLIAGLFTEIQIHFDAALFVLALAAAGAVAAGAYFLHQRLRPRERVSITYDLRLEQPLVPLGRYVFQLAVYYEAEEKGERVQTRQGEIVLRFRGSDHPDLLAWCTGEVQGHLERHRRRAAELHPGAEILVSPAPEPARIAERLANAAGVEPSV